MPKILPAIFLLIRYPKQTAGIIFAILFFVLFSIVPLFLSESLKKIKKALDKKIKI